MAILYFLVLLAVFVSVAAWSVSDYSSSCFWIGVKVAALGLTGIMTLAAFCGAVNWIDNKIDVEVKHTAALEERAAYVNELNYYTEAFNQGTHINGSLGEIHAKIVKFNRKVRLAEKWNGNIWVDGYAYDPAYVNIDPIPMATVY